MFPFKLELLESLNFSILGPHVKFQPTSNASLIKQTRNSLCDGCQFPPGQDVGLETRRLDTTELKCLKLSLCLLPKESEVGVVHSQNQKQRHPQESASSRQILSLSLFSFIFPTPI